MNSPREEFHIFLGILAYILVFFFSYHELLNHYENDILPYMPELIFLYGFISLMAFSFFKDFTSFEYFLYYVVLVAIVVMHYNIILFNECFVNNGLFIVDSTTIYIKMVLFFAVGVVMFVMWLIKDSDITLNTEVFLLFLLFIFGALVFLSAANLIIIYLGVELQGLPLYILCCLKRYSNKSIEAGLKYFIYGSYASMLMLMGISFLYLSLGTVDFNDINLLIVNEDLYRTNWLINLGFLFILIGFFFKLAIAPFHWWLGDVFEGSPDSITFFLALVPKLPFFFILSKFYVLFYIHFIYFSYIFVACGLLSIIIGSLLALYATRTKKLFAYSSIVHMGYMLIALSIGSDLTIAIAFFYYLIYLLSTVTIFSIFLLVRSSHKTAFGNVTEFSLLKNSNKYLAFIAVISLLSLAGIPPFMGFFGKLLVFNLLIDMGNYSLCIILLLLSILSCVYYIRLIRFLYFDDRHEEPLGFQENKDYYVYSFIVFLFLLNIIFIFFQETILLYIMFIFI